MKSIASNKARIPASYIFSYWIFVWAIIYILLIYTFKLSQTAQPKWLKWFNPTLALVIAFIWTTESLIRLYMNGASWSVLFKYSGTIVAIKAIPILLIYKLNLPFAWSIHAIRDLIVVSGVFLMYMVYLSLNGTTYEKVYDDLTESIEHDENRTPFEYILHRVAVFFSTENI